MSWLIVMVNQFLYESLPKGSVLIMITLIAFGSQGY